MNIIQIPGFNKVQGQQFFLKLNEALGFNSSVQLFNWSAGNIEKKDSNGDIVVSISHFVQVLEILSTQNDKSEIWAKSMGSYIAIEAIKKLVNNPLILQDNIVLKIFGLPYRLGYPPNINKLNALNVIFDDHLLAQNWIEEIAKLQIPVMIFQGEKDDLGPIESLIEQVHAYKNISVFKISGQGHSLDAAIVGKYLLRSNEA